MRSLWLLQHQRVGSTWLASTHLAQHPHIHMLKHGEGEACFGHFRRHRSNGSNVSCAGECQCFAQLLQHQDACKARKSRVCGWKAGANFCPTPRCASWLWSTLQPTVVHLYRRDMLRQAISLALARSSRIWTCRVGKPKDCHGRRPGNMVEAVFRALLRVVRQQRSTCAYMRRHAPRPWHQLAYEDLDNSTSRAQAIAAIYRHVGVHDNWTGWHDVRRRQSSREDAISLLGAAEYERLGARIRQARNLTRNPLLVNLLERLSTGRAVYQFVGCSNEE